MKAQLINNYTRRTYGPGQTWMCKHLPCDSNLQQSACRHMTSHLTCKMGLCGKGLDRNGVYNLSYASCGALLRGSVLVQLTLCCPEGTWKVARTCSGKGPQGGSCKKWVRYKFYSQITCIQIPCQPLVNSMTWDNLLH